MAFDLPSMPDSALLDLADKARELYQVRKQAQFPTNDVEEFHGDVTAILRQRGLIYEPLSKGMTAASGPNAGNKIMGPDKGYKDIDGVDLADQDGELSNKLIGTDPSEDRGKASKKGSAGSEKQKSRPNSDVTHGDGPYTGPTKSGKGGARNELTYRNVQKKKGKGKNVYESRPVTGTHPNKDLGYITPKGTKSGKGGNANALMGSSPGGGKPMPKVDVPSAGKSPQKGKGGARNELKYRNRVNKAMRKAYTIDAKLDIFRKTDYSTDERKKMAEGGLAMPDGSFPIKNEADLHNAVRLVHLGSDPNAAMSHIITRAKMMGMTDSLPKEWNVGPDEAPKKEEKKPQSPYDVKPKSAGMKKSKVNLDTTISYAVVKSAAEDRYTLGPVYMPNTKDAHGEWVTPEHLQKSMWDYVKSTGSDRTVYLQHSNKPAGKWVEVVTWPSEVKAQMTKSVNGVQKSESVTFPAGTAYMGVKWSKWAWEDVKNDRITGFSMGGFSARVEGEPPR